MVANSCFEAGVVWAEAVMAVMSREKKTRGNRTFMDVRAG
jgi:hypothetical protein